MAINDPQSARSVTIIDVAREAGVSIKTVSRVLNREEGAGAEVRARVLATVDRLGYRPNISARALSSRRSYLIGVIFLRVGAYHYVGEVQLGAMKACRRAGYHLVIEQVETAEGHRDADFFETVLRAARFDGVVLTPPLCDDAALLEAVERAGVPYVRMAPSGDLERSPFVWMDDQQAAREQTAWLWAMGHRRIAFVDGPPDHHAAVRRREGYLQAMRERGAEVPDAWVVGGDFLGLSGFAAGEVLLALDPPPTAIFAGNDEMALGVLAAAAKSGVAVPGQLSVVGFDDSRGGKESWPRLSTVHQPIAEMAEAAVDILIAGLGDARFRDQPPTRKLDYHLVRRGSAAPPQE